MTLRDEERAVLQLILRRGRSYAELSDMLSATPAGVRARAHEGLQRLAGERDMPAEDRGRVGDWLLGQLSGGEAEQVRALLVEDPLARAWATAVHDGLQQFAPKGLPRVPQPGETGRVRVPTGGDGPGVGAALGGIVSGLQQRLSGLLGPGEGDAPEPSRRRPPASPEASRAFEAEVGGTPAGERAAQRAQRRTASPQDIQRRRLLFGGGAAGVVLLIILIVALGGGGGGGDGDEAAATPTPSPPSATGAELQLVGEFPLTGDEGSGSLQLYTSAANPRAVAFQVLAEDLPPNDGDSYAIWFTGGNRPHLLGVAGAVDDSGDLSAAGPQADGRRRFLRQLRSSTELLVTRESDPAPAAPGDTVLSGSIRPDAAVTPTP